MVVLFNVLNVNDCLIYLEKSVLDYFLPELFNSFIINITFSFPLYVTNGL